MKIEYQNLRLFAYSNDHLIRKPIRGIVIQFFGLGGASMFQEDTEQGIAYAEQGVIFLIPYNNPWAWMNRDCVKYADSVIACVKEHYNLTDIPVISTGGSMGGLCALTYCYHAAVTPTACAANCPVCDLPYHYTERPDLPRTLVSAFGSYDMPLEEAMKTASPLHLAKNMPDIPYFIAHCTADKSVNKEKHSDRFVEILKQNHSVEYIAVPDRGHCDLTPDARKQYEDFILAHCK